jgi:hypothetical protein
LAFLAPVPTEGADRRNLAERLRDDIAEALDAFQPPALP